MTPYEAIEYIEEALTFAEVSDDNFYCWPLGQMDREALKLAVKALKQMEERI